MLFKIFDVTAVIDKLHFANAAKHWEKMAEQNALISCRLHPSDFNSHIGEKRLDFGQKVQNVIIEVSGMVKILFFQIFNTNLIESRLKVLMFSGIFILGNSHSL